MKIMLIFIAFFFFIIIIILNATAEALLFINDSINVIFCDGAKKHSLNHPGITENTLLGKRDIICPKCKCPLCSYVLVSEKDFYFPPRHINVKDKLLNQFKQLIQEIQNSLILDFFVEEKYQCKNCGNIFD